jgi:hypothetical protein
MPWTFRVFVRHLHLQGLCSNEIIVKEKQEGDIGDVGTFIASHRIGGRGATVGGFSTARLMVLVAGQSEREGPLDYTNPEGHSGTG